ncbi:unnamed protein product [Paramecium pentaurelia]|uniref:60S ribosomal protein L41 n=1 Tax=Paramecium pentaurelia TaxID=43138 RepID=A0A8S1TTC8_9CILI|nr:unnamed protein product [Paramecium pentaurelia]
MREKWRKKRMRRLKRKRPILQVLIFQSWVTYNPSKNIKSIIQYLLRLIQIYNYAQEVFIICSQLIIIQFQWSRSLQVGSKLHLKQFIITLLQTKEFLECENQSIKQKQILLTSSKKEPNRNKVRFNDMVKSNKYFEKNQSSKCYKIILKSQQSVYLFIEYFKGVLVYKYNKKKNINWNPNLNYPFLFIQQHYFYKRNIILIEYYHSNYITHSNLNTEIILQHEMTYQSLDCIQCYQQNNEDIY